MKLLRTLLALSILLTTQAILTGEEPVTLLPPIEAGSTPAASIPRIALNPEYPVVPPQRGGVYEYGSPAMAPGELHGYGFPEYTEFPAFDPSAPVTLDRLPEFKAGSFFQKAEFAATYLPGDRNATDMRQTELKLGLSFAAPLPTENHPLLISPTFETRFLDGPVGVDTPGQLYSTYVQFIWVPQITPNWSLILGVEPGLYGDFENSDDDAFRLLGRGLVRYQPYPGRLEFVAGLLYLDRDDVNILPAGGILWSPTDDLKLDIIFPAPKLSYRYYYDGQKSRWIYLAGEFGGDTWAVRRADGSVDRLTLRDLRASIGIETKFGGGAGWRLETGYVFGRNLEYTDGTDISLDDTILFRAVISY